EPGREQRTDEGAICRIAREVGAEPEPGLVVAAVLRVPDSHVARVVHRTHVRPAISERVTERARRRHRAVSGADLDALSVGRERELRRAAEVVVVVELELTV